MLQLPVFALPDIEMLADPTVKKPKFKMIDQYDEVV